MCFTHRDPSSLNDPDLDIPCMAAYGGPVDPNVALGDFGKCYNTIIHCYTVYTVIFISQIG